MTRTEHLKFCSICVNQKDGMRKGIICGLTNEIADFEDACGSFAEDTEEVYSLLPYPKEWTVQLELV